MTSKTPWYLRLIGKPAWRQSQPYLTGGWRYLKSPPANNPHIDQEYAKRLKALSK